LKLFNFTEKMQKLIFIFFGLTGIMMLYSQQSPLPENLVAAGAKVEKAGSGYAFTEGSSVAPDGRVFFTDQPHDRIYIWNENTGITTFLNVSERSNGTYFDKQANLIACADLYNKLVKFTPAGEMIVLYDKGFDGKHLNGPNDVWPDNKGGIYFTDPYYFRDYWEEGHKQLLDVQAVYYLKPSGELVRVIDDLKQPNGITGSPDGKYLFVADIVGRTTWKYTINNDGTLSNKTSFAPAGSDGMTIDSMGNIYLTFGKVLIFNNQGEKIGEIEVPELPSNLCFGGKDRKTLFITARTSVYTLKMNVKGVE
jgi:gluconolactonase